MNGRRVLGTERGSALVETAFGLIVLVSVIVYGIHFGEVSAIGMRLASAAGSALYNATGQQVHEAGSKFTRYDSVPGLISMTNGKVWDDFNPNVNDNSSAKIVQVMTQAQKVNANLVRCTKAKSLTSGGAPMMGAALSGAGLISPYDWDKGGVACTSSATVSLTPGFPKKFLDGKWSLKTANYTSPTSYTVCATPRSKNGNCGEFGVLLGDFSLQGHAGTESASHDVSNSGNPAFEDLVSRAFMASPGCYPATALSFAVAWMGSPFACLTSLSYKGVENNYKQDVSVHAGLSSFNTGGTAARRQKTAPNYYLGVKRF